MVKMKVYSMRLDKLDYNYFSTLILFIPFFLFNEMGLKEMYHLSSCLFYYVYYFNPIDFAILSFHHTEECALDLQ